MCRLSIKWLNKRQWNKSQYVYRSATDKGIRFGVIGGTSSSESGGVKCLNGIKIDDYKSLGNVQNILNATTAK